MFKNSFLKDGISLGLFNLLAGVLGYLFQIVLARWYTPIQFAEISSALSLFILAAAPTAALSFVCLNEMSWFYANGDKNAIRHCLKKWLRVALKFFLPISIIFFVFSTKISNLLNYENRYIPAIIGLILGFNLIYAVLNASAQANFKFKLLGLNPIRINLIRLLIFPFLMMFGAGVYSPFHALLLAISIVILLTYYELISGLGSDNPVIDSPLEIFQGVSFFPVLISSILIAFWTQIDVIIGNINLKGSEAGEFASYAILAKGTLFIQNGLTMALVPHITKNIRQKKKIFPILLKGIIVVFSIGISSSIFCYLFGDLITFILFGRQFNLPSQLLALYCILMMPLGLICLIEQYLLIIKKYYALWAMATIMPISLLVLIYHGNSPIKIMLIIGFTSSALCLITLYYSYRLNYGE